MTKFRKIKIFLLCLFLINSLLFILPDFAVAESVPICGIPPSSITLRAEFYTSYSLSTKERKNNIKLAAKSLNNTFIDVGAEFSFNDTVGERTARRGYQSAKIIKNGKYIDGVGGGVCQVSTTLYNAVLLSGLTVTESHSHSLPVSYVAPSFDAMVSSTYADLKFINNTRLPIIIKSVADDDTIKISIFGEPTDVKFIRKSVVIETLTAPEEEIIYDTNNEYPELNFGEQKTIVFKKDGYRSLGYLIKTVNGKTVEEKIIRRDKYLPIKGVIIQKA